MKTIDQLLSENPGASIYPPFGLALDPFEQKINVYPEPVLKDNQVVWGEIYNLNDHEKQIVYDQYDANAKIFRADLFRDISWRYERYQRELRMGLTPTDDIEKIDAYAKALTDITLQEDYPKRIVWPQKDF